MVSSAPAGMTRMATNVIWPHPDVRIAGVVQAQDVGFDLGRGPRSDVEVVLDLDLRGRDLIAHERERRGVHDRAALDGDDLAGGDGASREETTALDRAHPLFRPGIEPAAHGREYSHRRI